MIYKDKGSYESSPPCMSYLSAASPDTEKYFNKNVHVKT